MKSYQDQQWYEHFLLENILTNRYHKAEIIRSMFNNIENINCRYDN